MFKEFVLYLQGWLKHETTAFTGEPLQCRASHLHEIAHISEELYTPLLVYGHKFGNKGFEMEAPKKYTPITVTQKHLATAVSTVQMTAPASADAAAPSGAPTYV